MLLEVEILVRVRRLPVNAYLRGSIIHYIIIIIFIIYKAQYPKMLKALYNKIKSYLLCVKTNINNNKYNCKIYFQIKTNVETLNYSLYTITYYIQLTTMSKINK